MIYIISSGRICTFYQYRYYYNTVVVGLSKKLIKTFQPGVFFFILLFFARSYSNNIVVGIQSLLVKSVESQHRRVNSEQK